eukprot:scaffold55413_cov26-Tisochrysis_lutea.AAC.1
MLAMQLTPASRFFCPFSAQRLLNQHAPHRSFPFIEHPSSTPFPTDTSPALKSLPAPAATATATKNPELHYQPPH